MLNVKKTQHQGSDKHAGNEDSKNKLGGKLTHFSLSFLSTFPHCFFLPSFNSPLPGLEPDQNTQCLISGPNEAQALDVSLKKIE